MKNKKINYRMPDELYYITGVMKMFEKILVPVDWSELSNLAFEKAADLAQLTDAKVTVIHVIDVIARLPPPFDSIDVAPALRSCENERQKMVEYLGTNYVDRGIEMGVTINFVMVTGEFAHEIIKASSDYDLVVMGTLGRNPLTTLLLGSDAEKVARHASCPVMLVREIKREKTG